MYKVFDIYHFHLSSSGLNFTLNRERVAEEKSLFKRAYCSLTNQCNASAYMGNLLIHVRTWDSLQYYCGFDDTLNIEKQFLSLDKQLLETPWQKKSRNQSCKNAVNLEDKISKHIHKILTLVFFGKLDKKADGKKLNLKWFIS